MNAPTSNGTLTATFPVFLEHLETLRLEASAPGALQVRGYIQNRGKDGTSAGGQIQIPQKISNSIQIELPNSPLFIQTRLSKWTPFRDSWPWAMKPKPPHPFRVRFVRHWLRVLAPLLADLGALHVKVGGGQEGIREGHALLQTVGLPLRDEKSRLLTLITTTPKIHSERVLANQNIRTDGLTVDG